MRSALHALTAITALLATACFDPDITQGLACPDGDCPPGETCGADGFCHAEGNGDTEQSFAVSWRLVEGDWNTTDCESHQLDNVALKTYEVNTSAATEHWASCADGATETDTLPVGEYELWLEIYDADTQDLRVASPTTSQTLPADELVNLGVQDLFVDKGFVYASWNLVDSSSNPIDCVDIMATEVWFAIDADIETFPCVDGYGQSGFYPLGQHTVMVSLRDGSGALIGQEQRAEPWLEYGAAGVDLGYFELSY